MATLISDAERKVFAKIADALIPEAEGMPSATQVGVDGDILDRILGLRPDLQEAFFRAIRTDKSDDGMKMAENLNRDDPAAISAVGVVAAAAYYMSDKVRKLIGYPGQENRPANPDEEPEYITNGMLKVVTDRGKIYREA